jgi:hypothetical protein
VTLPLVYIAGPYGSDPVGNTRRAVEAGMGLYRSGVAVPLIPHTSLVADLVCPMPAEDWYAYDLHLLERCDAVWRLPGESDGADAEVVHALEQDIPVFGEREALLKWAKEWRRPPAAEPVEPCPINGADCPACVAYPDAHLLAHLGTDAMVWAKEFMRRFAVTRRADGEPCDEGLMVGWFANAIETGRDAERDSRIADLEARLADASHRAVTATEEARVATGILAKLKGMGVELSPYGPGRPDKDGQHFLGLDYFIVDVTDAEAALFDTITKETT